MSRMWALNSGRLSLISRVSDLYLPLGETLYVADSCTQCEWSTLALTGDVKSTKTFHEHAQRENYSQTPKRLFKMLIKRINFSDFMTKRPQQLSWLYDRVGRRTFWHRVTHGMECIIDHKPTNTGPYRLDNGRFNSTFCSRVLLTH